MKQNLLFFLLLIVTAFSYGQDDPAYPPAPATAQQIIAAEYFIDNDPGAGKAIALPVTPGTDVTISANSINTSGLTHGFHYIGLRTRNVEGKWSATVLKAFIMDFDPDYNASASSQNIIAAEYFIDADPGYGSANQIAITPGTSIVDVAEMVDVSGLTPGNHKLYIRTKSSEGHWSTTNISDFTVDADPGYTSVSPPQDIVLAECFIDTDPGYGNGHPISFTQGTDISDITFTLDIAGLDNGVHRLYLRTRGNEGAWGMTGIRDFTISGEPSYPAEPAAPGNIIAAEYFIDNDPGMGAGVAISVTPETDLQSLTFSADADGLSKGRHMLYVRVRNQEGKWSFVNSSAFYTDDLELQPDTLQFGNIPTGITAESFLTIRNNSSIAQTITSISLGTEFSTDAITPIHLDSGETDSINIRFSPSSTADYTDSVVLNTSTDRYVAILSGKGVAPSFSWLVSPTGRHDFGDIEINTVSSFDFTIFNTSNVAITLSEVISDEHVFVAQYTPNTVIDANTSLTLPVTFTPVAAGEFSTLIKIVPSTQGVDTAMINVVGRGYTSGTPPELRLVNEPGYARTSGVNPLVGPVGTFTYKVLYKSVNNKAPMAGYPKVSIDLNGNHTFTDADEGTFTMVKESAGNDYVSGVVFSYIFNHLNNTGSAGYQFEALDEDGNAATTGISYFSGPVVSNDVPDLRIFANDISFSENNPDPGISFTMTARVSNSSDVPVSDVPIKIYMDTIPLGNTVMPFVPAGGFGTFRYTLSFVEEGFYPIKVWIDSSNTLGENNVLNNYAIRPVKVGAPNLPGGINVTTTATRQECPELKVKISGKAVYYGTGTSTNVSGAEVSINTGSQIFKTTTDANGNYSLLIDGVTCGAGNFAYSVTITDFTFTSEPVSNSIPMPCPPPNACQPLFLPPTPGLIIFMPAGGSCKNIAGTTGTINLKIKTRGRDIHNMFGGFDQIAPGAELTVYINGEFYQKRDIGFLAPGDEVTIIQPWQIPQSTEPVTIRAEFVYTYIEYKNIPNTADISPHITVHRINKEIVIRPEDNIPDLSLSHLRKKNNTTYTIDDVNASCINAGKHVVRIYDGGTLLKSEIINALGAGKKATVEFDISSLPPGTHTITIVTDDDDEVLESNETNNEYTFTLTIPYPDLSVSAITTNPSVPEAGAGLQFKVYVKNTGKSTGSFSVRFTVDGVQAGNDITVPGLPQKDSILVTSDVYVTTSGSNECGGMLEVFVDSDDVVAESDELNNKKTMQISADLTPYQTRNETGSQNKPARIRVNNYGNFTPAIRNLGIIDAENVLVHYILNGVEIGSETIATIRPGEKYAAHGMFSYMFDTPGTYAVRVVADSANVVCESDETNNVGHYYIEVTDSKPDLEVLSQYVSPSSLNPNAGQDITIVGTVRNAGGKVSTPNYMRFFVDDVQLGDDVAFNALEPGKDTTVAATVTYSSEVEGMKMMKIMVDPFDTMDEERENNNVATRTLLVGAAPDMLAYGTNPMRFSPSGFEKFDSVTVSYSVTNGGYVDGSAWVQFMILDDNGGLHAIDSVPFALSPGDHITLSKKMYFDITRGMVVTQIVNCTPDEYNLLNNSDTLRFSTIKRINKKLTINGNLDLLQGLPDDVPGWIGGKLILEDFDLTVNGMVVNADKDHYIITNSTGRLVLVNNNTENTFPVGPDSLHTNFVKVANTGTPDIFSARVVPYVLLKGYSGDTVRTGNVNRTWFIDEETPGGSDVVLTFHWKEEDEQPLFDRGKSIVAHYITDWESGEEAAANVLPESEFSVSQTGINSFSPFTVTNVNSPVPLRLTGFEATGRENAAVLWWTSENENGVRRFVIERSGDGVSFKEIGEVSAMNDQRTNKYSFTDENIAGGIYYYRLRIEDIDGTYEYSKVRMVEIRSEMSIAVYPNPARNHILISGLSGKNVIRLTDMGGRILRTMISNNSMEKMDLYGLAKGVYNLIVISNNRTITTRKVMKE